MGAFELGKNRRSLIIPIWPPGHLSFSGRVLQSRIGSTSLPENGSNR